jgi:hypothetical protein
MNKFLISLISIASFLTSGCSNSGGAFSADSGSTISPIPVNLMSVLNQNLLWKTDCQTQGNRSWIFYISKSSDNKLILEGDLAENQNCDFSGDQWLQAIRKTHSVTSDNGSLIFTTKDSNEYILLQDQYRSDANQFSFCGKNDWTADFAEISGSSCDLTPRFSEVTFGYIIISESSVVFDGLVFNR